jgi:GTPase SAR1 family protein
MSKKIIFTGPPQVGKTTLRKIFFEGENPKKLLEYSLTPTHGQESILLKLQENIGVFDLAGQENQRWFETEAKSTFIDADIIICVLDISSSIEAMVNFAKKLLKLRNEITPSSYIYLLLHKSDLISKDELVLIEDRFNKEFQEEQSLKVSCTSIMEDSFLPTFSLFTEILKLSLGVKHDREGQYDLKFLEYVVNTLDLIEQGELPQEAIKDKLGLPHFLFNEFLDYLKKKDFIDGSKLEKEAVISSTETGRNYFRRMKSKFSIEAIKNLEKILETPRIKEIPPFLGLLLADENGRILMSNEAYEGAFDLFLRVNDKQEKTTDLEVIPMFISAIEKFAEQINIQGIPGFKLAGTNLKIHSLRYDLATFCLFMRTDVKFGIVEKDVLEWFDTVVEIYKPEIELSISTGIVMESDKLNGETKQWLEILNQKYNDLVINLEVYDFEQVKKLYQQLDDLYSQLDSKYSKVLGKIKLLKNDLMGAALDDDFHKVRRIAKLIKELEV